MIATTTLDQSELSQALFEESGDALFLLDPETDHLLDVNPVALRLTGFTKEELLLYPAATLFRFEAPGGLQRLRGAFTRTMVFHGQDGFLMRTKSENWVPVNLSISRLHILPKTIGLIVARDDRERRQAFVQARRIEAELRTVLSSSPAALWSAERAPGPDVAAGWNYRYVSPMLARLADRPDNYFDHPFRWVEVVHSSDREAYQSWRRQLLMGTACESELHYRISGSSGVRWVRDRLQVVRDPSGNPVRLDGCLVDISDQREAEEAVRQNEQRFRTLVEKSRDGILLLNEFGTIRYASPAVRNILGVEAADIQGRDLFAFIHPDDLADVRERLQYVLFHAGEDIDQRFRAQAADHETKVIEMNVCNRLADPSVHAVVVNYRDVTEPTRLEEQLRQSQKLEALGRLAGGIAHDFNNQLTAILGNLELARSGIGNEELSDLLAASQRAAQQAAEITRQLLGFARSEPLRTATLKLNGLVEETISLLRRTIDPRISIQFQPTSDLHTIAADPVQVHQILMNLCLNARDAMPCGGTLTICTKNASSLRHPDADAGATDTGFVCLGVMDTGLGMTPEVRAKIFEPFFTTKEEGQGTGLGLAVVYGVARAHGGWVDCASEPGNGSRFDVYLPQSTAIDDVVTGEKPPSIPASGQGELVLVADDEPMVRCVAQSALERQGYRVLAAADGVEAVDLFRRQPSAVSLIVMDVSMPQMSGREAFELIRKIDPAARVLFASGHSNPDVPDTDARTAFLQKPYTPSSLAATIRQMLDSSPASR